MKTSNFPKKEGIGRGRRITALKLGRVKRAAVILQRARELAYRKMHAVELQREIKLDQKKKNNKNRTGGRRGQKSAPLSLITMSVILYPGVDLILAVTDKKTLQTLLNMNKTVMEQLRNETIKERGKGRLTPLHHPQTPILMLLSPAYSRHSPEKEGVELK
ncbi:hypothetical protein PoB_003004400 [Plakobranchus ocellatus]|uniref:Uncharacterized protein n=1 Tax=Plakobranchus ocellatus TaxID=259542 RepID=A0AAV4ABB4_9GAST|nr:hypothetical protein PoB_003004400 [Plakobranchus ocellatus]